MKLHQIINKDQIIIPLKSNDKFQAIDELLCVFNTDLVKDFRNGIIEREKKMSTGIGWGVGIPHTYSEQVEQLIVAVGISISGIEFNSIDQKPVKMIFLNVSPKNDLEVHKQYLQYLSFLMSNEDNRRMLCTSPTNLDFLETLKLIEDSNQ